FGQSRSLSGPGLQRPRGRNRSASQPRQGHTANQGADRGAGPLSDAGTQRQSRILPDRGRQLGRNPPLYVGGYRGSRPAYPVSRSCQNPISSPSCSQQRKTPFPATKAGKSTKPRSTSL